MIRWFAASCVFTIAAAGTLHAQQIGFATKRTAAPPDPAVIEAQAKALHDQPRQYRRAAELYLQASDLRLASEPERVKNRKMAAQLFFYSGNVARARVVMEEAADAALAAGDIVTAAHTFLDASVLARGDNSDNDANRLARKAELLMKSPLVSTAHRQEVLGRIVKK
jgi:hypothetical protein